MRLAVTLCCLLMTASSSGIAYAQTEQDAAKSNELHIGVVAPFDGPYAILAKQIRLGTEAARLQNQYPVNITYMQENCKAEQDAETAERIRQAKIKLVIGYLCSESLEGAAPVLARDGIAILSLGSRQPNILEQQTRQNFGIFRLQPDRKMAIDVLVDQLSPTWRSVPFALLEDGTVQGRDFARQVLLAFKARGLEPALTDTYRPGQTSQNALVAQLKRAGINHILLGGEGDDASVIARSAAASGLKLTIAGGESLLRADQQNPLPVGLLMSTIPQADSQASAQEAVKAIDAIARKQGDTEEMLSDGYALPAYAAMQIAYQTLTRKNDPPQSAAAFLQKTHFDTAIGGISFTPPGLRRENPYRLMRFNGKIFEPVE